jgi:hypothetical protein
VFIWTIRCSLPGGGGGIIRIILGEKQSKRKQKEEKCKKKGKGTVKLRMVKYIYKKWLQ